MIVLSLFDGIAGAMLACQNLGFQPREYFASEIDANAIKVVKDRYPNGVTHIGDVREVRGEDYKGVDLLIGGPSCQDLSISGKRTGLEGEKSSIFYEYVRVLRESSPRYFLLENVASMKKEWREKISTELGVQPVEFCSSFFSAQTRRRLYWTNIPLRESYPKCNHVVKDILEETADRRYFVKDTHDYYPFPLPKASKSGLIYLGGFVKKGRENNWKFRQGERVYDVAGKSCTISASTGGIGGKTGLYATRDGIRRLTPEETETLQGIPRGFTSAVSSSRRVSLCGNSFTIPVISHILSGVEWD